MTAPGVVENPYGTHGSTYAPSVHSDYSTYRPPPSVTLGDYGPNGRLATNVWIEITMATILATVIVNDLEILLSDLKASGTFNSYLSIHLSNR